MTTMIDPLAARQPRQDPPFAVSIVSPPGYAHSEAFREVAESIHYGLLELGRHSIVTVETNLPGHRHIILGSNLLARYPMEIAPDSILYNLEQISLTSPWLTPAMLELFERHTVWDYSQDNITQLRLLGVDNIRHVPVGYVPQLTRIPPADKDIDVLFIGSLNERRMAIVEELRTRGVRAEAAFGVYGAERDHLIARARIVLNIHYYASKVFEVVRVSYLLANRAFVISEQGGNPAEEEEFASGVVFAGYDDLVETCLRYLERPDERAAIAQAGFTLMAARRQAAILQAALEHEGSREGPVTTPSGSLPVPDDEQDQDRDEADAIEPLPDVLQDGGPHPRVSIVIPCTNKANLTLDCVTSLVETTKDCGIDVELIMIDNGSTDETSDLLAHLVEGDVTVIRNEETRSFGYVCNQGARASRGEFILFLNNDTIMLPGWLPPLVAAMDEDPRRGAVQPRMIFPNGRLNDTGGQIFRNGDAWSYGKHLPVLDAPLYSTRRAPDYINGACMLVRRTAFFEVGGFDLRYTPIYCEDSDLSFALRAAGWTLLYEPASTIVHIEGVTNGTDINVGTKRFQVVNQVKFARKWQTDLDRRPVMDPAIVDAWAFRGQSGFGPGEDPALRGTDSPSSTIMYIDPFPPMWDRHSGGRRMLQMLRNWRLDGHAVVHVAATAAPERRRYAEKLSEFGVVLYGLDPEDVPNDPVERMIMQAAFLPDLSTLLLRHRPDVVVLSLWSTAEQYLPAIRQILPGATIVVDSHDIHFLREQRAAELAHDPAGLHQVMETRQRELAVYAAADRVICVSEHDAAVLRDALPACDIVVIGNAFDDVDPGPDFDQRSGLLFVGNANHTPNLDALLWWQQDIGPRLAARLPGVRLTAIGNDPVGAMKSLAGGTLDVTGWVPDTLPYLHAARLSVAPLRYGAGIKGKIGEAMMAGLPVVGTPIAVEGMGLRDGDTVLVGRDADEFVDQIVRAYTDRGLWTHLRTQELALARFAYGTAAMRRRLPAVIAPKQTGQRAITAGTALRTSV